MSNYVFAEKRHLRAHLYDSSKIGFLTANEIAKQVNKDVPMDIYFCGPKPMRESLRKGFEASNLKVNDFHKIFNYMLTGVFSP